MKKLMEANRLNTSIKLRKYQHKKTKFLLNTKKQSEKLLKS